MTLWALGVYAALVVAIVAAMLTVSYLLGERHRERATADVYESGMVPTGGARARFSVHYYLIAMLFVIFDLEAVVLFAWAVAAPQLGWAGYVEMAIFVGVLLVALAYLWRVGALDWGPSARQKHQKRPNRARPMTQPHANARQNA